MGESGFDHGRRVAFGFHDFGQEFDGLLDATEASLFFFDTADEVVEFFASEDGERVEEFLEAFGAAKGVGESGMDIGTHRHKTLPRMVGLDVFTDFVSLWFIAYCGK